VIKVAKARTVRFEFDPFDELNIEAPKSASERRNALDASAEYLGEQILKYVGEQQSPVKGYGAFDALTDNYAKTKKRAGHPPIPNLEFSGDMLSALKTKRVGDQIVVEITGKQGAKADGHNNHSGESSLPLRRFIPGKGETFEDDILSGISRILETAE
jgi:hypothetical protein